MNRDRRELIASLPSRLCAVMADAARDGSHGPALLEAVADLVMLSPDLVELALAAAELERIEWEISAGRVRLAGDGHLAGRNRFRLALHRLFDGCDGCPA